METGFLEQPLQSASADGTHAPLTVLDLFDQQVQKTPHHIAVQYGESTLTYRELDEKSNQLANYLLNFNVQPNQYIAICMHNGLDCLIAIWGILKSGAAYLPIDPKLPRERIKHIVQETQTSILLTKLPDLSQYDLSIPSVKHNAQNIAYVIFTSGSTGHPNGIIITHDNLLYSTRTRLQYYCDPVVRYLLLSPISFDSSVAGIFWTLLSGGTFVIPSGKIQDIIPIASLIQKQKITHFSCIPCFYHALLQRLQKPLHLCLVIVGSEACFYDILLLHQNRLPHTHLYNEYGPTECCVWSTVAHLYDAITK